MSKLRGTYKSIDDISLSEKKEMYQLLQNNFDGIRESNFEKDLSEKDFVILLKDSETEEVKGFSTLLIMDFDWKGRASKAVFSGDTIIDAEYRGTRELPKTWCQLVFSLQQESPDFPWYWFLISSGYKTYRFLPVYFNEFYPRYDQATPQDVQEMMDYLASLKFGNDYDINKKVIRFSHSDEKLKPGVADVTQERLQDPHIGFFIEKNPFHYEGDELVCICEIRDSNFSELGCRVLGINKEVHQV